MITFNRCVVNINTLRKSSLGFVSLLSKKLNTLR